MKKSVFAGLALLICSSNAYAAGPGDVGKLIADCCSVLAACCEAAMACCG